MNLFEKIFNYQIISRLENTGTFMITAQERSWLKTMLAHPSASEAFTPDTLEKLQTVLTPEPSLDLSEVFIEKANSVEKQVYHPLLRTLRRFIMNKTGVKLTYRVKDDRLVKNEMAFPYKLEYSLVKKEWYLLWYHLRHRALMSTKLQKIDDLHELPVSSEQAGPIVANIEKLLEKRQQHATIEVIKAYHRELSRILYAFSCFEKNVAYDNVNETYTIRLTFLSNESEYVLSKLRFLGKRVKVIDGDYLKRRMLESARKAYQRYEVL
ncbi:WYL domain-containing protein [Paenibacillus sp. SYP-B3998]|uniref:WYL domain-containing protein n=1 Tax=Paenibacillus sp. SYP-B3998 TaxID=2678564 RepID=A0A6G4A224_9BACL|nr:WYL domain-containing protein [Paenibacillus sp. SYP-B3998]NEW07879.1 WYL domain-containing protein [Paenibacillus sp. SYP-B3998]